MRRSLLLVCLCFGLAAIPIQAGKQSEPCQSPTAFLERALQSVARIQPGSTRVDVEKDFEMDGGEQIINPSRYVWKECQYIKIDVEFKAADGGQPTAQYAPTDVVVKVGTPYLAYPISD